MTAGTEAGISKKVKFTAKRLADFRCSSGKDQSFLWDSDLQGLGLRVTASDSRAFIYEGKLAGKSLRVTIGNPKTWTIEKAQVEARRLRTLVDQGLDPRVEKAIAIAKASAAREELRIERARRDVTAREAWDEYCEIGRREGTGKKPWGDLHQRDHLALASPGGQQAKRGSKTTAPGPLAELLSHPLVDLTSERLAAWLQIESAARSTRAALAFRLLRAFLNWCADHKIYRHLVDADGHKNRAVRNRLATPRAKNDCLQRKQIKPWFNAVRLRGRPPTSSYFQCLLLTGARTNELARLKWSDVDFRWQTLRLHDKVAGTRVIPLTDFVAGRLRDLSLNKKNSWVFATETSKSGHITDPSDTHDRAVASAKLPPLTLHGLRRTFTSMAEWVGCPVGIAAQIQGHKPSATVEKHYKKREVDLLRVWHQKIERWMLNEAGLLTLSAKSRKESMDHQGKSPPSSGAQ